MFSFRTHARRAACLTAIGLSISLQAFAVVNTPDTATGAQVGSASSGGTLMNPAIAVDGLFALSIFNRTTPVEFAGGHDPQVNGFNIQQVELTFGANIDPYFRGDA